MKDLQAYYDQDYHHRIHDNLITDELYYWARAEAFKEFYFSQVDDLGSKKILDYGCGLGQATAAIKNTYGYDASKQAQELATAKGLKVFKKCEEIPVNFFDIVICRHVLEHLPDPLEILKSFGRYLKPEGMLILVLPREFHKNVPAQADDHMHLYAWNFRAINNLLSVAGLRVIQNRTLYHWGFQKLLPIRKWFGQGFYIACAKIIGRLTSAGELVIEAHK